MGTIHSMLEHQVNSHDTDGCVGVDGGCLIVEAVEVEMLGSHSPFELPLLTLRQLLKEGPEA